MMKKPRFGAKQLHSVHVKGNTLGTSNEISFSVLDAKKKAQGGEGASGATPLGKIALFSLPDTKGVPATPARESGLHLSTGEFVSATPPSSASATAGASARRERDHSAEAKAARKKMRMRFARVGAAVACVAAIAFGVYSLVSSWYEGYLENQSAEQLLEASLSAIVEADDVLAAMDATFADLLGVESLEQMSAIQDSLDGASSNLGKANMLAQRAARGMTEKDGQAAAQNALDTIEVRRTMLENGRIIVEESLAAKESIDLLQKAWGLLLEGDSLMRTAVSSLDVSSTSAVKNASEQAISATLKFKEARDSITLAAAAYDKFDDTSYLDYVDLRLEALEHFAASCAAALDEDTDTLKAENAQYNELDARAVLLAEALPTDVSVSVTDAYAASIADPTDAYTQAAKQAASLDAALREYLKANQA